MELSISKKLPEKKHKEVSDFVESAKPLLDKLKINISDVVFVLKGEKYRPWTMFMPLPTLFIQNYIIFLTKKNIHVVRNGTFVPKNIIEHNKYSYSSLESVSFIQTKGQGEKTTLNFRYKNRPLELYRVPIGFSEYLKDIFENGIENFIE